MEPVPSSRSEDAGSSQASQATGNSRSVRTAGGRSLPVTTSNTTTTASKSNTGSVPVSSKVPMAEPSATPTMGEMATWEIQLGDDQSTASQGPDFRKTFEMATPTLVDEVDYIGDEEDEEEMISLARQRLLQDFDQDVDVDAHLRRTPGAHMSRSLQLQLDEHMRRTPGATQMHRSAGPIGAVGSVGAALKPEPSVGDASGLGFGLTLSTPVAASKVKPASHASPWSSSRDAPWGLPKASASTDSAQDSYSPTTERLTVDLGSLLLEDETEATSQFLFGDKNARATSSKPASVDSWSTHFNLESMVSDPPPKATKPAATIRRRGKTDGGRRSSNRSYDRPTNRFPQDTQQPKPVRGMHQPAPVGFDLFGSSMSMQPHVVYGHAQAPHGGDPTPLFQRGGAFAPLPKAAPMGGFQPPPPSMAHPPVMQPSMGALPNFQTGPSSFDPTVQQPISFGPPMESFPSHTEPQNAPLPVNRPVFDFQGQMPAYGYPGAATFQPVQPFFPMPGAHPQQPQMPHFGMPPPVWTEPSWTSNPSPWQMGGEFGFVPPPTSESPILSMTPTPSFVPGIESQPSDLHSAPGLISPSPVPSVKSKKIPPKGAKKQGRPEKGPRAPETTVSQVSTKPPATNTKRGKKKQSKDRSTPSGQLPSATPVDDVARAYVEETADSKKGDASKALFNKYKEKLKTLSEQSFAQAEEFVKQIVNDDSTPASVHCKVHIELVEMAKRANKYETARRLCQEACEQWPTLSLGWLEYSKLEEDCGNMKSCLKIVYAGLELEDSQSNDNSLLLRAIKLEEKMGDLPRARELLARLKHGRIEDVWKIVSEGAQLEARAGNNIMARRVLKYLMHHRPWHGPLYHDVYKFEKELGRFNEAFEVVERGLTAKPDYGPLWFDAMWLCEQFDYAEQQYRLPKTMAMVERATSNIIRETVWKIHLEAAQMLERSAVEYLDNTTDPTATEVLDMSRRQFTLAMLTCSETVRWKVWLAAGRMEAVAGNPDRTRKLVRRAHTVVLEKQRAVVLLECARHEEFFGDKDLAKAILAKSRSVCAGDWKVWLESVLFEVRYQNVERAVELAVLALTVHSGTGRLWASLVQLRHDEGEESQFQTLKLALNAVPKSGEVWCEGARVHLNPLSRTFDIPSARRQLVFATKFTPQFGDGFLETLRLEIVDQWLVPIAKLIWDSAKEHLLLGDQCNDDTLVEFVFQISRAIHTICHGSDDSSAEPFVDKGTTAIARSRLQPSHVLETLDVVNLRQRCANADPNYGSLWFYCGAGPTATARKVWSKAVDTMLVELRDYAHVYLAALIRSMAILARFDRSAEQNTYTNTHDNANVTGVDSSVPLNPTQWEESIMAAYMSTPSLESILREGDGEADTVLLGSLDRANFATGLVGLSQHVPTTLSERRKALFGTDALFS